MPHLARLDREAVDPFGIVDQPLAFAIFRKDGIAQDGEQPGFQIRPRDEAVAMGPALEHGFLDQIVRFLATGPERAREGPEARNRLQQLAAELAVLFGDEPAHLITSLPVAT